MGNFLFLILAFFLFVTNPEQPDFDKFVQNTFASKIESGNSLVDAFAGTFVSGLAKEVTQRKNYYCFSVYTVDLSVLSLLGQNIPKQIKVLGVANQFIPLDKVVPEKSQESPAVSVIETTEKISDAPVKQADSEKAEELEKLVEEYLKMEKDTVAPSESPVQNIRSLISP